MTPSDRLGMPHLSARWGSPSALPASPTDHGLLFHAPAGHGFASPCTGEKTEAPEDSPVQGHMALCRSVVSTAPPAPPVWAAAGTKSNHRSRAL